MPPVLQLRLQPDQPPMVGAEARIVKGFGVSFDLRGLRGRRRERNGIWAPGSVVSYEVLFPGARETWPLEVDEAAYGSEATLEVSDLGRPGRVAR